MHPGIELRISTPAGVVVQCDSDFAHYSTMFRGVPPGEWYTLLQHVEGQAVLDEGQAVLDDDAVALLKIELRAVELEDAEVPDDARELLAPDGHEQLPGPPAYNRTPTICEPCNHMCPGTAPACCGCGSPDVVYSNFRSQPFCARCADGADPGAGRRRRWPWSRRRPLGTYGGV